VLQRPLTLCVSSAFCSNYVSVSGPFVNTSSYSRLLPHIVLELDWGILTRMQACLKICTYFTLAEANQSNRRTLIELTPYPSPSTALPCAIAPCSRSFSPSQHTRLPLPKKLLQNVIWTGHASAFLSASVSCQSLTFSNRIITIAKEPCRPAICLQLFYPWQDMGSHARCFQGDRSYILQQCMR
jgi:hypothetical protein